jgi:hypothetical protein
MNFEYADDNIYRVVAAAVVIGYDSRLQTPDSAPNALSLEKPLSIKYLSSFMIPFLLSEITLRSVFIYSYVHRESALDIAKPGP